MKMEWLTELCSSTNPSDICRQELAAIDLCDASEIASLGRSKQLLKWIKTKWNPFASQIVLGDELWRIRSPSETWQNMAGCAGYAIVRDGKIAHSLVTARN